MNGGSQTQEVSMKQYKVVREVTLKYKKGERIESYKFSSPHTIFNFLRDKIGDEAQENVIALYLDNKNELHSWSVISRGTVSESLVHPREVYKYAIMSNSSSVVMSHNHPSGELQPSKEDIATTKRIMKAGELVGIPLLDHIIMNMLSHGE